MNILTTYCADANNTNKQVTFRNCARFTDCISEINSTQIDNAKNIDLVMSVHNLIEYSGNYSNTSGRLWQYYRDEPSLTAASAIEDFTGVNK